MKFKKMLLPILAVTVTVILIFLIIGRLTFDNSVKKERTVLFSETNKNERITVEDLEQLPERMKQYLLQVGVIGKPKYCNITFRQNGSIRTDPNKKWLNFKATQYMSSHTGGFIWNARSFPMMIRDKYMSGKGEVKVNLLGIKNVAVAASPETHQSSLGRYFGELLWFPIGFLDPDISWEEVDSRTVKGVIVKHGISFEGFFHFDEAGLIHRFTGKRYRDIHLDDFTGKAEDYKEIEGLLIPGKMTAIWNLEGGDLEYFVATISDYNIISN